jgi:hypothetical protein
MSRMKVASGNNSLNALFVDKTLKRVTGKEGVPAEKDMKKLLDKGR